MGSGQGKGFCATCKVSPMIVQQVNSCLRRTCGSVRSSLSAPARLVTVGSEAAETTFPPRHGEKGRPRGRLQTESVNSVRGTGWMTGPTQVNCRSCRHIPRAKGADRLQPKWQRSRLLPGSRSTRTFQAAGGEAGAKSSVSSDANMVNLTSRLHGKAGRSARRAVGVAGRGCWKKRRPSCNGTDRSQDAPPRKRAHFQRVVDHERASRTTTGGNRK